MITDGTWHRDTFQCHICARNCILIAERQSDTPPDYCPWGVDTGLHPCWEWEGTKGGRQ